MHASPHARDLAEFLAPMPENIGNVNSGPGSHQAAASSRPAVARLRRGWASICTNAIVGLVVLLAWALAWPPLQVRPQAGVLALEVFAV